MEELYIAANHATNVAYFPHDLECHWTNTYGHPVCDCGV